MRLDMAWTVARYLARARMKKASFRLVAAMPLVIGLIGLAVFRIFAAHAAQAGPDAIDRPQKLVRNEPPTPVSVVYEQNDRLIATAVMAAINDLKLNIRGPKLEAAPLAVETGLFEKTASKLADDFERKTPDNAIVLVRPKRMRERPGAPVPAVQIFDSGQMEVSSALLSRVKIGLWLASALNSEEEPTKLLARLTAANLDVRVHLQEDELKLEPAVREPIAEFSARKQLLLTFVGGLYLAAISLAVVPLFTSGTGSAAGAKQRLELELTAFSKTDLVFGHLLGAFGVGTIVTGLYTCAAIVPLVCLGELPVRVIPLFVTYSLGGLVMNIPLCFVLGLLGSSDGQPSPLQSLYQTMQALIGPLIFVATFAPNSLLAERLAYFPPTTPFVVLARATLLDRLNWWEPVTGLVAILSIGAALSWVALRIFRVVILMRDEPVSLRNLIRLVLSPMKD